MTMDKLKVILLLVIALLLLALVLQHHRQSSTERAERIKAQKCAEARAVADECRKNNGQYCDWWFEKYAADYCKGAK